MNPWSQTHTRKDILGCQWLPTSKSGTIPAMAYLGKDIPVANGCQLQRVAPYQLWLISERISRLPMAANFKEWHHTSYGLSRKGYPRLPMAANFKEWHHTSYGLSRKGYPRLPMAANFKEWHHTSYGLSQKGYPRLPMAANFKEWHHTSYGRPSRKRYPRLPMAVNFKKRNKDRSVLALGQWERGLWG
jgi:hypothetical protein